MKANPAWVDTALRKNWSQLEGTVGPAMMPIPWTDDDERGPGEYAGAKGKVFQEYGSGHYGTVLRTRDPGIVLKVTSDPTEAQFVQYATSLGEMPDGLVHYFRIIEIVGSYRKRSIYAIWREAAHDIGIYLHDPIRGQHLLNLDRHTYYEGQKYLRNFQYAAGSVRTWLRTHPHDLGKIQRFAEDIDFDDAWEFAEKGEAVAARFVGIKRISVMYASLKGLVELMESTDGIYLVGGALGFYLEHNVLLADVHANNVGLVDREDYDGPIAVITDPGHAVFLNENTQAQAHAVAGNMS